jgi:hypothetical protein
MRPPKTTSAVVTAQKIKIPICLDAVVIVLVPFMRRLIPFPEFLEPTHQSGLGLFRKSHHPNLLALHQTVCVAWSRCETP